MPENVSVVFAFQGIFPFLQVVEFADIKVFIIHTNYVFNICKICSDILILITVICFSDQSG